MSICRFRSISRQSRSNEKLRESTGQGASRRRFRSSASIWPSGRSKAHGAKHLRSFLSCLLPGTTGTPMFWTVYSDRIFRGCTKGEPDEGQVNLACLAARLVVNPRSGLHPSRQPDVMRGCIRTQLQSQARSPSSGASTIVFKELLGDDAHRNTQVLGAIGEQLDELELRHLDLSQNADIGPNPTSIL